MTLIAVWWLVISFAVDGGVATVPYPNQAECLAAAKAIAGQGAYGKNPGTCIPGYIR